LTLTYFSMALSCFWLDFNSLKNMAVAWGPAGFLKTFFWGTGISFVALAMARLLRPMGLLLQGMGTVLFKNYYLARASTALMMLVVFLFWLYGGAFMPEIVYKAF